MVCEDSGALIRKFLYIYILQVCLCSIVVCENSDGFLYTERCLDLNLVK